MTNRFYAGLLRLPGPVWAFGTVGVLFVFRKVLWDVTELARGNYFWTDRDQTTAWLLNFPEAVFWGAMLWGFAGRKRYAVPLAGWFAFTMCAQYFVGLLSQFLHLRDKQFFISYGSLLYTVAICVAGCAIWLIFMRYLERSATLAQLFPREERRVGWLVVGVLLVAQFGRLLWGLQDFL